MRVMFDNDELESIELTLALFEAQSENECRLKNVIEDLILILKKGGTDV